MPPFEAHPPTYVRTYTHLWFIFECLAGNSGKTGGDSLLCLLQELSAYVHQVHTVLRLGCYLRGVVSGHIYIIMHVREFSRGGQSAAKFRLIHPLFCGVYEEEKKWQKVGVASRGQPSIGGVIFIYKCIEMGSCLPELFQTPSGHCL